MEATKTNTKLQFRVLYRQFLFRLMDVELLSASAHGDAFELLGQFGSLLVFGGVLLAWGALPAGQAVRDQPVAASVWPVERFLISLTMLVVGVFTLLSWDSTFLDRRDVLVLAPLPVRVRTLFAAKIAAVASSLGLTVAVWNCIAGFACPIALAPPGSGFAGTIRCVAAFWVTLLAAGTFLYCTLLGVQAVAAQLPRRWYLRVSSVLQIAAFILLLGVLCFQPSRDTATALGAPENQRALAWLPSYWFLGLLSEMSGAFPVEGHAVMAPLARRAVASLAIAIFVAGGAFLLTNEQSSTVYRGICGRNPCFWPKHPSDALALGGTMVQMKFLPNPPNLSALLSSRGHAGGQHAVNPWGNPSISSRVRWRPRAKGGRDYAGPT